MMATENVTKAKQALAAASELKLTPLDAMRNPTFCYLMLVAQTQALVSIAEAVEDRKTNVAMKKDGTERGYL